MLLTVPVLISNPIFDIDISLRGTKSVSARAILVSIASFFISDYLALIMTLTGFKESEELKRAATTPKGVKRS